MGESNAMDAVVTAITGMATTVQTNALDVIAAVLPVLGVVVAAVIVARLGYKMIKRFSG